MRVASAIVVASLFTTSTAFAEDIDTLEKQLREEHAALSTQDCVTACKALASIRRAADRICALEQGPRCSDARAKADDAQRRVQAACPDCQIAATPPKDEEQRATQHTATAEPAALPGQARKGGCASCSTPGDRPTGDFGVVILGAWAISRVLRKKSSGRV
jgi:hypothetical protein